MDRSDVAFGHQGISSGGGITEIRNPELPVLHVERYTGGVYQARLVSFNNTGRRHVALIGRLEHENRLTHIIRYIQIAVLRVQSHGGRPVHLRLRTLNDAYWRDVAIGVQRIDRNRRRMEFTGTGNAEVTFISPIVDEQQLVLCIDGQTMDGLKLRMFTFDEAQRLLFAGSAFAIHHYLGRVLNGDEHLRLTLIDGDAVTPMRRVQEPRGSHISQGIVRKNDDLVARVGFDRIDVANLRINIKTVVKLDVRLVSLNQPLRFGNRPIGPSTAVRRWITAGRGTETSPCSKATTVRPAKASSNSPGRSRKSGLRGRPKHSLPRAKVS